MCFLSKIRQLNNFVIEVKRVITKSSIPRKKLDALAERACQLNKNYKKEKIDAE